MGVDVVFKQHRHSMHGTALPALLQLRVKLCCYGQCIRIDLNHCIEGWSVVINGADPVKVSLYHIGNGVFTVVIALLKLHDCVFLETERIC